MGINEFGEKEYKKRKPQTEQQILARNEGRALGHVGMILSNLRELCRLGFISPEEHNRLACAQFDIRGRIINKSKERMKKAGTWTGD